MRPDFWQRRKGNSLGKDLIINESCWSTWTSRGKTMNLHLQVQPYGKPTRSTSRTYTRNVKLELLSKNKNKYSGSMARHIVLILDTKSAASKKEKLVTETSPKFWNFQRSHCGSGVTNPSNIHEDKGSIPGFSPWVKDPALPSADAAWIPQGCGRGCGVGWQL